VLGPEPPQSLTSRTLNQYIQNEGTIPPPNGGMMRNFPDEASGFSRFKSRAIDYVAGPGAGAVIGGAYNFATYDAEQEKDPMLKENSFIGRMKSAGEGAFTGALVGLGGVAADRFAGGVSRALMTEEQRKMLPAPASLTSSFISGFKATAGASGSATPAEIAKRIGSAYDDSSPYALAARLERGINVEAGLVTEFGEQAAMRRAAAPAQRGGTGQATATAGATTATPAPSGANPPSPTTTATPTPTAPVAATTSTPPTSTPNLTGSGSGGPPPAPAPGPAAANAAAASSAAGPNEADAAMGSLVERISKQRQDNAELVAKLPQHIVANNRLSQLTPDILATPRGLQDLGSIVATTAGAALGSVPMMAKQFTNAYDENILKPNEARSAEGTGLLSVRNPWLSEGADKGDYVIRQNLGRQMGDLSTGSNTTPGSVFAAGATAVVSGAAVAGLAGTAAFGAASASSYGAPSGHPLNALNPNNPAVSARAQMEADATNKIRMSNPRMIGLNDAEEMYYQNPSMRPVQSRARPGQYNDSGNLTLALSALRRG
jgi:hypothetical protein